MVSNFFESHRGGVEIVAGQLARHLAAKGFDVRWLAGRTTPPPIAEADPKLGIVGLDMWNLTERRLGAPFPLFGPVGAWRLFRAVKSADAVILHDSVYPISVATFLATRWFGKPLLVVQHVGEVPFRNQILRRLMALANRFVAGPLLGRTEQVVFISEVVRDFFRGVKFGRLPRLIFNGVDTTVFRPPREGEKAAARQRFDLPAASPAALFVGRFVEKKGLHFLRQAAIRRPDILWVFAGWGVLDPAAWNLPNVRVVRTVSGHALADLYRASDVLVLPSDGEGFPLVIQEALACGLPVVCGRDSARADQAALPHLVAIDTTLENIDGVIEALSSGVDNVLAADNEQALNARSSFAFERYAWPTTASKYAQALLALNIRSGPTE
jgi:glycosyltransferase involved in cell wall biosynthesis